MTALIIMGILQGLTEFLPISSSGHLLFIQSLFKIKDINLSIDIFLHLATFFVIIIYFFKDIKMVITGFIKKPFNLKDDNTKLLYIIAVGTIPTLIIAFLLKNYLPSIFEKGNILYITWTITAILLIISDTRKKQLITLNKITFLQGIIIGIMQGIAVFPGISRSGITIITALFLGINRKDSARFSFLLGLPVMLAAFIYEFKEITKLNINFIDLSIVFVITFICGFIGLVLLIKLLNFKKLKYFGFYLLALTAVKFIFKL